MTSPVEIVSREVIDLKLLLLRLSHERCVSERGAIRERARLTQTLMLYVSDVADTTHPTWKELGQLTHKILIETVDVERFNKRGAGR